MIYRSLFGLVFVCYVVFLRVGLSQLIPVVLCWPVFHLKLCDTGMPFHLPPGPGLMVEYCDTEVFTPECGDNEVIVIHHAFYGRMQLGHCVKIDLGYLGCHSNVLSIIDRRCSGRRECSVRVPDADLEATVPCLPELKTYLEINYTCQAGMWKIK